MARLPSKKILTLLAEVIALILIPAYGMDLNQDVSHDCSDFCAGTFSPFFLGRSLFVVYFLCVAAYFGSRYRKTRVPWRKSLLNGFLLTGMLICVLLTVHLGSIQYFISSFSDPFDLIFKIPLAAPPINFVLFLKEWYGQRPTAKDSLFFGGLLAIWALLHRLIFKVGLWTIFTQTCGWFFSLKEAAPFDPSGVDCHYLCTVAARGHPALVKPLRMGKRHGKTIIVNRQLQIANAFEDLLHELTPRFGKFCRQTYDLLGLPISRLISKPLLSDLVYLAMKPLEWFFYLFLVLFDPENPEKRIARMYR